MTFPGTFLIITVSGLLKPGRFFIPGDFSCSAPGRHWLHRPRSPPGPAHRDSRQPRIRESGISEDWGFSLILYSFIQKYLNFEYFNSAVKMSWWRENFAIFSLMIHITRCWTEKETHSEACSNIRAPDWRTDGLSEPSCGDPATVSSGQTVDSEL